jgi:hypothetical protein
MRKVTFEHLKHLITSGELKSQVLDVANAEELLSKVTNKQERDFQELDELLLETKTDDMVSIMNETKL